MAEINCVDDFIGAVARGERVFSPPASDGYDLPIGAIRFSGKVFLRRDGAGYGSLEIDLLPKGLVGKSVEIILIPKS